MSAPLTLASFLDRASAAGATSFQQRLLLRAWLAGAPLELHASAARAPFGRKLRAALGELEGALERTARVVEEHAGADGSLRWLVALADGRSIESVLLPRSGMCASTQIGCAVGCRFCKTGESGLARNLSDLELLAQVALARTRRPVERVVLMGMGEPSHNLPAVLSALSWLGREGRIGHKRIVFSTVGDPRAIERLRAHDVRPALALSLHSTFAAKRAELLPRAPRIDPAELVELADGYARAITWPVQFQWTLLAGHNDGDDELERLIELLSGRHGMVNFIAWNSVDGAPYARASRARALELVAALRRAGILATLRESAGQDVEGGCGQLRARAHAGEAR